jgi:hypothetical protein
LSADPYKFAFARNAIVTFQVALDAIERLAVLGWPMADDLVLAGGRGAAPLIALVIDRLADSVFVLSHVLFSGGFPPSYPNVSEICVCADIELSFGNTMADRGTPELNSTAPPKNEEEY